MLSKKTWEPEAVLALVGTVVVSYILGNVAAGLLHQAGVIGFKSDVSLGYVLLPPMSFHGVVIVAGTAFSKISRHEGWRDIFGATGWKRLSAALASLALLAITPLVFVLKYVSELVLQKLHWPLEDQAAVEMILNARLGVRVYLFFFALVLVPLAEEFFFRGLLFSLAKRHGWPKLGWFGVSFLFALAHANAPTFLPLFVLALGLTWL